MYIRPATSDDLFYTSSISVDCFWNDELHVWINPKREQHPSHFRDFFLRRHRLRYWQPEYIFQVAVTEAGDKGHVPGGKIVGFAIWDRRGSSEIAKSWRKQTWRGSLELALLKATDNYIAITGADRSLDPARLAHFWAEANEGFEAISELWKLQSLCVHVDHQRQGIGSKFIDWGKEQAEREGCPICLESSWAGMPMYLKNGFRRYGQLHIRNCPLDDVPTLIWEPRGMEGRWGMKKEVDG